MSKRGQPKIFKTGDELIELWQDFCDDIIANNFETIPSQTAFCKWLRNQYSSVDRKTIYNSLNKYFPNVKKDFESIRADIIMQGGMLGKYQPTMSIFGLKNWCSWVDKTENINTNTNTSEVKIDLSKLSNEEIKAILNDDI